MSANQTGTFNTRLSDKMGSSNTMEPRGNVSRSNLFVAYKSGSGDAGVGVNYTINVSHTHTYYGDIETRPQNYTVRIWKRTA